MADPKTPPKTLDDVEMPETEPYRVAILGATYMKPTAVYGPTGPTLVHSNELATRGEIIYLDEAQGNRLTSIGAVKKADDPRSYEEMSDKELHALTRQRSVNVVVSQVPNEHGTQNLKGIPLRADMIAALQAYDAGASSLLPIQEGPLAVPAPTPVPEQNVRAGDPIVPAGENDDENAKPPESEVSEKVLNAPEANGANVNALAAYIKKERVTADDMVTIAERSDDTPEAARALLEAETVATGGDPRTTLVPRLQALIDGNEGA